MAGASSASSSSSTTRIVPRTRSEGPESILIVGGGATGLVSLRNLVEERGSDSEGEYPLFEPLLVERRQDVGGVWYWSDETYSLERELGPDRVQGQSAVIDPQGKPHWPSPAYLNLRGNVLPEFLEFSGKKFPKPANGETFPTLAETHQYLREFAAPYRPHIRCNVEVIKIEELVTGGWRAVWKDWQTSPSQLQTRTFDRVIVAAGWYDTPYYPQVEGMQEAREAGHVHHCKHYRDSSPYRGKKVVVVGNNNSANEVAAHLAIFNSPSHPVYKSAKTAPEEKCPSLPDDRIKDVGMIVKYQVRSQTHDGRGSKVDLTLLDGTRIDDVDYVILGTGYGQRYPFVHVLTDQARQAQKQETEPLTPDSYHGTRVPGMYNHCLYSKSPDLSLGFVGLIVSFMPFSLADLVSAWIACVWAGHITTVPSSISDRLRNEQERLDWMYERRLATLPPGSIPPSRTDPLTYVGYHHIGGSLATGPPSELHFSADLYNQIHRHHPQRASQFTHKWDHKREQKQYSMYAIKKNWLVENQHRIKTDPFDLLGKNEKYRYLAKDLVHPSLLQQSQNQNDQQHHKSSTATTTAQQLNFKSQL